MQMASINLNSIKRLVTAIKYSTNSDSGQRLIQLQFQSISMIKIEMIIMNELL